ncbi:flagellar hook capping FlgD N-terminal domain-containing protein [Paracoccaceae bacterium Fryx2]|nr:flagellar hook capping FlgD N-terminal domain-containing protein [Paracoccaceae bacterium Fryx2]
MQNQDPLNPIDSSDYAVQLATFSGVEQQVRTNQLLEGLYGQFDVMGMAQLAGWVGREARAAGPAWVDGSTMSLSPNPAALADRAVLVVRDNLNRVVAREDVDRTSTALQWEPVGSDGEPLPEGKYTFQLESYSGENLLGTNDVEVYARVLEARGGAGGTILVLKGGIEVLAGNITALRAGD